MCKPTEEEPKRKYVAVDLGIYDVPPRDMLIPVWFYESFRPWYCCRRCDEQLQSPGSGLCATCQTAARCCLRCDEEVPRPSAAIPWSALCATCQTDTDGCRRCGDKFTEEDEESSSVVGVHLYCETQTDYEPGWRSW
jgi:hypothetical protein